jgi:type II secretory pathway pseudopilin PulG
MRRGQRGASGVFVAVILLLAAVAAIAVYALSRGAAQVERGTQAATSFRIVQDALLQYVSANGSLPCPANPALDTGDADPAVPTAACNSATGTVPWKAIGIRREDAIDPWGGKISYRVYAGASGLTQANGASMVDCDTVQPLPSAGTVAGGLCGPAHDTTEAEFLNAKGLMVTSFGNAITDAAYVLVSHGPSGLGAFTAAGVQKPLPASADELANLSAAGPFVAKAASAQGVGPGDAAHFDDLLAFAEIGDVIRRAGRGARDWPDAIVASVTFDAPTLTAALGAAPSADTGQTAITFPGVRVSAFASALGTSENVSFATVGGVAGIGGYDSGTGISSGGLEGIRLEFGQKARKLGVTFNDFGVSGPFAEQAELRFFDGATLVATLVAQACRSGSPDPLASFSFDLASADFDNVEVRSLVTTPNGGGATQDSVFLLAAAATCPSTATTCRSSLYDSSNACP